MIGDVDEYGRELLDDRLIPDLVSAPPFGRWRGGLIHPDRPTFMISRAAHDRACAGGWVSSTGDAGKWWGLCPFCNTENAGYDGSDHG